MSLKYKMKVSCRRIGTGFILPIFIRTCSLICLFRKPQFSQFNQVQAILMVPFGEIIVPDLQIG